MCTPRAPTELLFRFFSIQEIDRVHDFKSLKFASCVISAGEIFVLVLGRRSLVVKRLVPTEVEPDGVEPGRPAAKGAALGAATGAIIGNNVSGGNAWGGAAIGAAVGGLAGDRRGKVNSMYYRRPPSYYYYRY